MAWDCPSRSRTSPRPNTVHEYGRPLSRQPGLVRRPRRLPSAHARRVPTGRPKAPSRLLRRAEDCPVADSYTLRLRGSPEPPARPKHPNSAPSPSPAQCRASGRPPASCTCTTALWARRRRAVKTSRGSQGLSSRRCPAGTAGTQASVSSGQLACTSWL